MKTGRDAENGTIKLITNTSTCINILRQSDDGIREVLLQRVIGSQTG